MHVSLRYIIIPCGNGYKNGRSWNTARPQLCCMQQSGDRLTAHWRAINCISLTHDISRPKIYDGEVPSSAGAVQDMGNILFRARMRGWRLYFWQTGLVFVCNISYFGAMAGWVGVGVGLWILWKDRTLLALVFWSLALDEGQRSGQVYTTAALSTGKEPSLPTEWDAV